MEETTMFLLITIAVLIILSISWRFLSMTSMTTNIPGPAPWPIIGNAHLFLGVNNVERALEAFSKMAKTNAGPLSRIWMGPKLVVLVKSPKYIEALLTHKAASAKDAFFYRAAKSVSGNGVFTREGEEWQRLRKPLTTLAQPKNIKNIQEMFCCKVDDMCEKLQLKNYAESFNISPYIKLCSFELINEAVMGMDVNELLDEEKCEIMRRIEEEIEDMFVYMWRFQSILGLTKYNPQRIHKQMGHMLRRVLKKRKIQMKSQRMNYMTDDPENYMDVVLRAAEIEKKTEDETSLLLIDLLIAGLDTQSVAITVLLHLLAMHQDYQERVYQELVGIFGHSDRNPEQDDLRQMVYLEMCIKEALRHCSPPAVARVADEDIEIDGYVIPKGAMLLFTLYLTLEDPQYWERPDEFFPEHFHPEAVAKRPKGTFLPFVAGPRMCPGQLYSYQAMKTIVSTLLRRFHFTTDQKYSELKYKYSLMREPVNPLVKICRRQPPTNSFPDQSSNS